MEKNKEYNLEFNIIKLGDSGVGKISILERYSLNRFGDYNSNTIGMVFSFKNIFLKNDKKVKLKLVDTAGQER